MPAPLAFVLHLGLPFAEALAATREALRAEGFGILAEIDLAAAFREKLGRAFRPYVILAACNPPLAYAAVSADPSVGLLLPCNVTVEAMGQDASVVRLTDPEALLGIGPVAAAPGTGELRRVATDARDRLERVALALGGGAPAA